MRNLSYKKKKSSEIHFSHVDVYLDEVLIGYYISSPSAFAAVNANWEFVSNSNSEFENFNTRTRAEMIDTLEKQAKNEQVTLQQDFGITKTLNQSLS